MSRRGPVINTQQASDDTVGNTKAAELLGVRASNVRKMLLRYGVEGEEFAWGERKVHRYPIAEIHRVRDMRLMRRRKRADVDHT